MKKIFLVLLLLAAIGCSVENETSIITKRADFDELVTYQIMVGAYRDTDNKGYGVGYGPTHHNGDLRGIIEALPYIENLGVNSIWLTPVFTSGSVSDKLAATGYFIDDYFNVDPKFGTNEDLRELVEDAHSRGIYVFLDGVFGHHGKTPIEGVLSGAPQADGYMAVYPQSLEFYKRVATYWIEEYEIDGWRVDQAYQMYQAGHNYMKDIREAVEEVSEKRRKEGKEWGILGYMVGEIWDGSGEKIINKGYDGDGLRSFFDFPTRYSLVQILAIQENTSDSWAKDQPASKLNQWGFDLHSRYPEYAQQNMFLTNHDLVRFGDLIERGGFDMYWERHRAALSFLAAYTGPITLYYGDEYGAQVEGFTNERDLGLYDDHASRDIGRIDEFNREEKELIDYTKKLLEMRKKNPALYRGERKNLYADSEVFADLKVHEDNKIIYILNASEKQREVTLEVEGKTANGILTKVEVKIEKGKGEFILPPMSGSFYEIK